MNNKTFLKSFGIGFITSIIVLTIYSFFAPIDNTHNLGTNCSQAFACDVTACENNTLTTCKYYPNDNSSEPKEITCPCPNR